MEQEKRNGAGKPSLRYEKFTSLILSINRSVQRIKSEEMAKLGLKGVHVNCLHYLGANPDGVSQSELVKLCCEDKAYINRAVAYMSELGIVEERDGGKKYNTLIRLTEHGQELVSQVAVMVDNAVRAGSDGLTDADRDVLYASLQKVSVNLENYSVD